MKRIGLALLTTAALSAVSVTSAEARGGFGGFHGGFGGGFHGAGLGGGFRGGGFAFRGASLGYRGAGWGGWGWRRSWGWGGFGAGLVAGNLLGAANAYAYPWYDYDWGYGYPYAYGYPTYSYGYGYPTYSYGYPYPAEQVIVVRRPRRVVSAHRSYRPAFAVRHRSDGVHARFASVHRVGAVHDRMIRHAVTHRH